MNKLGHHFLSFHSSCISFSFPFHIFVPPSQRESTPPRLPRSARRRFDSAARGLRVISSSAARFKKEKKKKVQLLSAGRPVAAGQLHSETCESGIFPGRAPGWGARGVGVSGSAEACI